MKNSLHLLSCAVIAVVLLTGCDPMGAQSPSDVVKAAYMAANEGNEAEVERHLSAPDPAAVEIMGMLASGGKQQQWKPSVKKGSLQSIEILNEEASAYRATVKFKLHFKGGAEKQMQVPLIKEGGVWKIER